MHIHRYLTYGLLILAGCKPNENKKVINEMFTTGTKVTIQNNLAAIKNIPLPDGFKRESLADNTFGKWLQNVALKKDKTVYLFDGSTKNNQEAQFAVLDISVGRKNLQQCADAVMRLRAEYLFANNRFEEIEFTDNDGTAYNFTPPYTTTHFIKYLDVVFGMCGSASLAKQLNRVKAFSDIKAGDVIIKGGFPGHAVIVMDVAANASGKKIYLLAQSYMPAQDIHVLINPNDNQISPWYFVDENTTITTPEYLFKTTELKTW